MVEAARKVAGVNKTEAKNIHAHTWGIQNFTELNHALQVTYPYDQKTKKIPKLYKAMKKIIEENKMFERSLGR